MFNNLYFSLLTFIFHYFFFKYYKIKDLNIFGIYSTKNETTKMWDATTHKFSSIRWDKGEVVIRKKGEVPGGVKRGSLIYF